MDTSQIEELLRRLNTAALAHSIPSAARALVVINEEDISVGEGTVRFHASFPVRAAVGAQPVTVRDEKGEIVSSRLTESTLTAPDSLPADRRLWTLTLEFVVAGIQPNGWLAYTSTFGASPDSREADTEYWAALPILDLPVFETDCRDGDLPPMGTFDATAHDPFG